MADPAARTDPGPPATSSPPAGPTGPAPGAARAAPPSLPGLAAGPAAVIGSGDCRLVLIDYQARLMPAIDGADTVLREALLLADTARLLGVPVLGTEQNPAGLGPTLPALRERCDLTLAKLHFDACEDGLLGALGDARQVVVAGCEAHVCLLQTALALLRAGLRVWVAAQASGSRAAADKQLAMQRLRDAGAGIVATEMVVFEWLHGCRHPRFKEVQARLKQR